MYKMYTETWNRMVVVITSTVCTSISEAAYVGCLWDTGTYCEMLTKTQSFQSDGLGEMDQ
jgi:hypothetical protein